MSLRDVVQRFGHRRIVELLSHAIVRGTLPQSLIFAGPANTGKLATAIAVAQALNCSTPRDGDACGKCAQCERIARGVHPDVFVVEPGDSGSIRIDQVRDVIERAAYKPFEGKQRVVIVNGADTMMAAAQNALLKTLEEPAPSSVFVLLTDRADVLLPTVLSRCIRLRFAERAETESDVPARDIAYRVLIQAASGSEARRLDGARELLSNTGGSAASDREQVASHLRAMATLLRDLAVISARATDETLVNADIRPDLERLAPAYQRQRGVVAFAAIDLALEAIESNVGVKVVADWLVLQL